jgi:hypothetical protein
MILEVFSEILVSFGPLQNLEILDLPMAKDEKVNIAASYLTTNFRLGCKGRPETNILAYLVHQ